MGRLADTAWLDADPMSGVATIRGRYRLPSDVVTELMDVLADEPAIVVCDMTGMAATTVSMVDVFAPVRPYLTAWPGALVVVCVPDAPACQRMAAVTIPDRLLVHTCAEAGLAHARSMRWRPERLVTPLAPIPAAAPEARAFTSRALLDWGLWRLVGPASLVVSELVTNAVLHQVSALDLTMTRVQSRVRIGVHDHGGGGPRPALALDDDSTGGRGLTLIEALTCGWGVLPSRRHGKTVWTVLDAAHAA